MADFYLTAYLDFVVGPLFLFSYIMLTMDRFLMAYLCLRYPFSVTLQRVYRLYMLACVVVHVIGIIISFTHPKNVYQLSHNGTIFIWLPGDILVITTSITTYSYIFSTKRKLKRNAEMKTNTNSSFTVLLILSYIMFSGIPDFTYGYFYFANQDMPRYVFILLNGIFSLSYTVDAFLYLFSMKSLRRQLFHCSRKRRNNSNISVIRKEGFYIEAEPPYFPGKYTMQFYR